MDAGLVANILGVASVGVALVGAAIVVTRLVNSLKAEENLRDRLSPSDRSHLEKQFCGLQTEQPGTASDRVLSELNAALASLVEESEGLSKTSKQSLLTGLRQPSEIGKRRYALKLYRATVSAHGSSKAMNQAS